MGTILIVLGVVGAVALLFPWPWAAGKIGWSTQTKAAVTKMSALVDEAAFLTSLTPAYLLALKRGDGKIKDLLGQCRVQAATWDDALPPSTPAASAPAATPTWLTLAAEIETLKAQLAAKTTSDIPAASINGA